MDNHDNDLYNLNYIDSLYVIFNSCFLFENLSCPYYPYVRFHDIRKYQSDDEYKALNTLSLYIKYNILDSIINIISSYNWMEQEFYHKTKIGKNMINQKKRNIKGKYTRISEFWILFS